MIKKAFLSSYSSSLKEFFFYIIVFILTFVIFDQSISILNSVQPDSEDYIGNNERRRSIYFIFMNILDFFRIDVFLGQKIFLAASIVFLLFILVRKKIGKILCIIFFLSMVSNIYYTSFTKTILPESLFFTCINFSLGLLIIRSQSVITNFFRGIFLGLIFSMKAIGPVIATTILIFFLFKKQRNYLRNISVIVSSFFLIVLIENIVFYSENDHRSSVWNFSMKGKIFMISGLDSFDISKYSESKNEVLIMSKETFKDVQDFLKNIKNPFLKSDLSADYEVIAQYQFLEFDEFHQNIVLRKDFEKNIDEYFVNLIKFNFLEYIQLSFSHYLGMWTSGSKILYLENFLTDNNVNLPMKKELFKASGPMRKINNLVLLVGHLVLVLVLIIYLLATLFSVLKALRMRNFLDHSFVFVVVSQLYLIVVSFTNVATIRYLMPVYPIIILSIVFSLEIFLKKNSNH